MRILVLGKGGQLGWEACRCLACLGEVTGLDYPEVDFNNLKGLEEVLNQIKPNLIYNAAAYTAVDKAEKEQEKAFLVNSQAPGMLAEWARKTKAVFVHFSTDYVFDGRQSSPYSETDETQPLSIYGQSKLDGENNVKEAGGSYLIFRTAWVYSRRPESFVGKVLTWSRIQTTLNIVSDQTGSPTWSRLLAEASTQALVQGRSELEDWVRQKAGLYHLAGEGETSRYEWAKKILALDPKKEEQVCRDVLPSTSAEFPTQAERPLYSALDSSKFKQTFGLSLGDWLTGLSLVFG